ncbi:MAG: hypothetical protein GF309_09185 [Candidatus Lokiarchaeota archaeon]|nr:hypothetical protein [Candidatus Lokiarchaeota archaeon]
MKKSIRIALLVSFVAVLFLVSTTATPTYDSSGAEDLSSDDGLNIVEGPTQIAGEQDEASWWNSTFLYRRYYNITEPGIGDRQLSPVHLYLTFEDGHCYDGSIRVGYYDGGSWEMLPFQTWNVTYYTGTDFVKSARVSFKINVSEGMTEKNYYVYYADDDVGTVGYPDFYPFTYTTYTYSLINLVSYYDSNNYTVEMWDDSAESWDDPQNVDTLWANNDTTPTNVPTGTLGKYDGIRYEPSTNTDTEFVGFYKIQSNYPLAVSAGRGNKGVSNSALNDWFPGVDELGQGTGTHFVLGGVEGFDSNDEGKYWIQAHQNDTEVSVMTTSESPDSGWYFFNRTEVTSWPAILDAGEYIMKGRVNYKTYMVVNSSAPVSVRSGDHDAAYSRDIMGPYPTADGKLAGSEFYTIDMGHSEDRTRVINIGDSSATIDVWRMTHASGWTKIVDGATVSSGASYLIGHGSAGDGSPWYDGDPEDILHIKARSDADLTIEGIYMPDDVRDYGDWSSTTDGYRFGTEFKVLGGREMKFFIHAVENANVTITGANNANFEIPAGGVDFFMPQSSSYSMYNIESNATISISRAARFDTTSPYGPNGDQGYGWMVPSYGPEGDENALAIEYGEEIKLFEFDITVKDLDGLPIEDVTVTLHNSSTGEVWTDDNGLNRTGTTDSNGLIVFEGLNNATYEIRSEIDAANWLTTSYDHVWIRDTSNYPITSTVTNVEITLDVASFDIYLHDLMNDPMSDNPDEDTNLRLNNETGSSTDYIAQGQTNSTGWVHFNRVPQDDYKVYARYAGSLGWSYGYDEMEFFGSWSISQEEFNGGGFEYDWTIPLITLDIHVTSWDDLPVENAYVKVNNSVDPSLFQITKTTDENGDYSFYRIANGTWNLDVWKNDDYSQTRVARNYTVVLDDLQGYTEQVMELPISRLAVRVQTGPTTYVEGAQVNVTLKGNGLIAQGTTNSTGHVTFFYIHANMSNPYYVGYNLTAESADQKNGTTDEILAKCDYDWEFVNIIFLQTPDYPDLYTELNSTKYFINKRWGENATFTVGYFDRDGANETHPISFDSSTWVNFTIYLNELEIGSGTWNQSGYDWVEKISNINFTVTIDTDYWLMNVSDTAYRIEMTANTDSMNDPTPISVYVTVLSARTAGGAETTLISEYYSTNYEHLFWLEDTTNEENVTELTIHTYSVRVGTLSIRSGNLIDNGNGTYSLPSEALTGLPVDTYLLDVFFNKPNYLNQTIQADVSIQKLPMEIVSVSYSNYEWAPLPQDFTFQYVIQWNGTNPQLDDLEVDIEWINHETGISYINVSKMLDTEGTGDITYSFTRDIVPVGEWDVRISCTKGNYTTATYMDWITVSEALTTLTADDAGPISVDWASEATFQIEFLRNEDSTGLEEADFTHNWNGTFDVEYDGGGIYLITVGTTVESGTYTIELDATLANHESKSIDLFVDILVPLTIETEYGSTETPLEVYWTRTFDLEIRVLDNSRFNTSIDDASVSYSWEYGFIIDQQGTLSHDVEGVYSVTLDADDATPIDDLYPIVVTAERPGSMNTTRTVYVRIQEVPNEIVLEKAIFTPYYADVFSVRYYWNNTLDNAPIDTPSDVVLTLNPLGIDITEYQNYGNGTYSFEVDTRTLGMNVFEYTGTYSIQIEMDGSGYQSHDPSFVVVVMQETPTELVVGDIPDVEWEQDLIVTANLTDIVHDEFVWINAVVELVYGETAIPMVSHSNGTFSVTIDTEEYFASRPDPYELEIEYTIPNYVDGVVDIEITIDPRSATIIMLTEGLDDGLYEGDWTDQVNIQFQVGLVGQTGTKIEANATYYWTGFQSVTGQFSFNAGTDVYSVSLNTTKVPAGDRTLRIVVTRENYTVSPVDIEMTLNPLAADLSTDTSSLLKIHTVETAAEISFALTYKGTTLEDATIQFDWGGIQRTASFVEGEYVFEFNPSVEGIEVPKTYLLNFTTQIQNYSVDTVSIPLTMLAPTELTGPAVYIEEDQSATAYFRYWDTYNDRPVDDDADAGPSVSVFFPGDEDPIQPEFNGTHYYFSFEAADLGEAQTDPYEISLTATASGYQNHTATSGDQVITLNVYVSPPTYNIPLVGRVQRSLVNLAVIMFGLFVLVVGSAVGIQRWRRPHAIKQIESAISDMEENKTATVDDIKSMGMVVSDLLAAGLAELDMKAPRIDTGPEVEFEETLGEEAEDLLGELDALDEISEEEPAPVEEAPDYEAELEAELEEIEEEEGLSISDISGVGPTLAERLEEAGYGSLSALSEADADTLADIDGISMKKAEAIVTEAELLAEEPTEEDLEGEMEPEEPSEEEVEPEETEAEETAAEEEEVVSEEEAEAEAEEILPEEEVEEVLPEDEGEESLPEEEVEEILPEEDVEEVLPDEEIEEPEEAEAEAEEAPDEESEAEEKPLTKRELIEQLPDYITESMSEDEIKKLSKKELEALIEGKEGSEE